MNSSADLEKAYAAFSNEDYVGARAILEGLENMPLGRAHLHLAWMCEQGLGGVKDAAKAEHHFRRLAENGDIDGKYYLAASLQRRGQVQLAVGLYEEAANLGHVSSAYWAYSLYSKELNHLTSAPQKAQRYLVRAAELGHIFAQRDLAYQQANASGSFSQRFFNRLRYLACKLRGVVLIFRNSQDLRIR